MSYVSHLVDEDLLAYRELVAEHVAGREIDRNQLRLLLASLGRTLALFDADCRMLRHRQELIERLAEHEQSKQLVAPAIERYEAATAALNAIEAEYRPKIEAARREYEAAKSGKRDAELNAQDAQVGPVKSDLRRTADSQLKAQFDALGPRRGQLESDLSAAQLEAQEARNRIKWESDRLDLRKHNGDELLAKESKAAIKVYEADEKKALAEAARLHPLAAAAVAEHERVAALLALPINFKLATPAATGFDPQTVVMSSAGRAEHNEEPAGESWRSNGRNTGVVG